MNLATASIMGSHKGNGIGKAVSSFEKAVSSFGPGGLPGNNATKYDAALCRLLTVLIFRQHTAYEAICSTVCSAGGHSIGVGSNQQEPVAPIHTARIAGPAFGDYPHTVGADPIGLAKPTHDGIQSRRPSTGRRRD